MRLSGCRKEGRQLESNSFKVEKLRLRYVYLSDIQRNCDKNMQYYIRHVSWLGLIPTPILLVLQAFSPIDWSLRSW